MLRNFVRVRLPAIVAQGSTRVLSFFPNVTASQRRHRLQQDSPTASFLFYFIGKRFQ